VQSLDVQLEVVHSHSMIVDHLDESTSVGTAEPVLRITSRLVGLFELVVFIHEMDWHIPTLLKCMPNVCPANGRPGSRDFPCTLEIRWPFEQLESVKRIIWADSWMNAADQLTT
jgi:hypothetical protein